MGFKLSDQKELLVLGLLVVDVVATAALAAIVRRVPSIVVAFIAIPSQVHNGSTPGSSQGCVDLGSDAMFVFEPCLGENFQFGLIDRR